jgi:acyl-CoA synthetase (AMP-forming)/AMP-acid ligase II
VAARKDVPDPAERAIYFPRFGVDGYRWKHSFGQVMKNRLVDPGSGAEITAAGRVGELRIQGPTVFAGYWNAPELTAAAFEDGWFRTGDLFEIAGPEGRYFRFVGRLKDIVLRGGQNISCEEIEGYLCAHPDINEAAIVGAPDPVLGERICACVVPREGAVPDLRELNTWLREHWKIAVYKQLERIELFESLPRNPVGKILKRELRATVAARGPEHDVSR